MSNCWSCAESLPPDGSFCLHCGVGKPVRCTNSACGHVFDAREACCLSCGAPGPNKNWSKFMPEENLISMLERLVLRSQEPVEKDVIQLCWMLKLDPREGRLLAFLQVMWYEVHGYSFLDDEKEVVACRACDHKTPKASPMCLSCGHPQHWVCLEFAAHDSKQVLESAIKFPLGHDPRDRGTCRCAHCLKMRDLVQWYCTFIRPYQAEEDRVDVAVLYEQYREEDPRFFYWLYEDMSRLEHYTFLHQDQKRRDGEKGGWELYKLVQTDDEKMAEKICVICREPLVAPECDLVKVDMKITAGGVVSVSTRWSTVAKVECGHMYHPECLDTWLEEKHECPECRHKMQGL